MTSLFPLLAAVTGCAIGTSDPTDPFGRVTTIVEERIGERTVRDGDDIAAEAIASLLEEGLSAQTAVRVALVNNRNLRAIYADLGFAQADLVQAGLLHNPVLHSTVGLPVSGGAIDLTLGLALDVIDFAYVPLRKRVAAAELEKAELRVAASILDTVWRTRRAFTEHQAREQMLEMREQVADATGAGLEVSERMQAAGNITKLDLARDHALADEARLELRSAEIAVRESRERLNSLLGLWGTDTAWELGSRRLPDPPAERLDVEGLEKRVVERSLDLAAAERRILAAAELLGLDRASAFLPEAVVGTEADRDDGRWTLGPSLVLPLPFFDRGQARITRAKEELRRARDLHHALAVRVRSAARAARDRLVGEHERVQHYRTVQLPLRGRIVQEAQLQYNAMQIGVFELLRAREDEIATGVRYVETLRRYWHARNDLELLLAGRLPPVEPDFPIVPEPERLPRFPFSVLH